MDQIKIGNFIAEQRKKNGLTQIQLAEQLNITDRAISKWETGRSMPDSSIMLELCSLLKISVNELLSGEVISMNYYNEKAEQNLLEMKKQKEECDKNMLKFEIIIGYMSSITFILLIFIASFIDMNSTIRLLIIIFGTIIFTLGVSIAIKIEQVAGYYECNKCHYKYIPNYKNVLFSMHYGRTRYMKCPKCNKRSWTQKVISK